MWKSLQVHLHWNLLKCDIPRRGLLSFFPPDILAFIPAGTVTIPPLASVVADVWWIPEQNRSRPRVVPLRMKLKGGRVSFSTVRGRNPWGGDTRGRHRSTNVHNNICLKLPTRSPGIDRVSVTDCQSLRTERQADSTEKCKPGEYFAMDHDGHADEQASSEDGAGAVDHPV